MGRGFKSCKDCIGRVTRALRDRGMEALLAVAVVIGDVKDFVTIDKHCTLNYSGYRVFISPIRVGDLCL